MENLQDLFTHEVGDLYSAEKQLLKALPKMRQAARSKELSSAFDEHIGRTEEHIGHLERIMKSMPKPARDKCPGMKGLIEESREAIADDVADNVVDAALIGLVQRAEHYGIAAYGTARAHATRLSYDETAALLQQMLDDQKRIDRQLTEIAETMANARANANAGGAKTGRHHA
jgi:ferritin-like metal-binding protein YciE